MKIFVFAKRAIFLVGLYKVGSPLVDAAQSLYNVRLREQQSGVSNIKRINELYGGD